MFFPVGKAKNLMDVKKYTLMYMGNRNPSHGKDPQDPSHGKQYKCMFPGGTKDNYCPAFGS